MSQLTAAWSASSLTVKLAVVASCVVLIALLIGGTQQIVSRYKDRQADKAIATERAIGEGHRKRADEAETRAQQSDARAELAELAVAAAGRKAEAIAEKLKVEDAKLIEEMQRIGADTDICERLKRLCSKFPNLTPADCKCQ